MNKRTNERTNMWPTTAMAAAAITTTTGTELEKKRKKYNVKKYERKIKSKEAKDI